MYSFCSYSLIQPNQPVAPSMNPKPNSNFLLSHQRKHQIDGRLHRNLLVLIDWLTTTQSN